MAGWMRVQCLVNGTLHPKPPPYADLVSLRTTSPEFPIDSAATGTNSNLRAEQATEQKWQVTLSCKQTTSCYLLFCREKCGNVEKPLPPPLPPNAIILQGHPRCILSFKTRAFFPLWQNDTGRSRDHPSALWRMVWPHETSFNMINAPRSIEEWFFPPVWRGRPCLGCTEISPQHHLSVR